MSGRNSDYLIGNRYGKLVVLSRCGGGGNGRHYYYLCRCDCGNEKIVGSQHIGKDVFSCGCLVDRKEHTKDTLYTIYKDIKRRCYNKQRDNYKYYGGKGIKMCDSWKNNYQEFKKWAFENGYIYYADKPREERLSIDRIDSNKDYCPDNCRWIPFKENRKRSQYV